jgi:hypothetical protein
MHWHTRLAYAHVSFVVSNFNNHVLSWGINGYDLKKKSVHSEEVAWSKFVTLVNQDRIPKRWLKRGVHMVNVALTRTYKLRMSRPCRRCSKLIERYSNVITEVVWTNQYGECCQSNSKTIVQGSKLSSGDQSMEDCVNQE